MMEDDRQEVKEAAESAAVAAASATSGPQTRVILRVVLIILAVAVALFALYMLEGVILLLVLAIFFAYLIAPLVELVRRPVQIAGRERVMPRALAIGIVYLVIFGSIGIALYLLLPRLYDQIPQLAQQAQVYFNGSKDKLNNVFTHLPAPVAKAIKEDVPRLLDTVGNYSTAAFNNIVGWLGYIPWMILIPILAFFLLKDAESFRASALQMLPRGRWRWRGDEFFQDVNSTLAAYIRAQLTACLLIGLICTGGFWAMGVPYFLVLGLIAGVMEFIPLVGPITVAVAVAIITSFQSVSQAFVVLLFLAVLRIVQDYVLYPRIIGQGIHLHPLAVILAILCGAELAGIAGVFLAIPVIAIITVSYRHWLEHRGSEGLVQDFLKPVEQAIAPTPASASPTDHAPETKEEKVRPQTQQAHPTMETTPEQMAHARPDLTTGELKLRTED